MSLARRLDAADGVIDGKYFGRPIVETTPVTRYSSALPAYRSSTAVALDAADGVIDGKYYGRPIIETAGGSVTRRIYGSGSYGSGSVTRRIYGDGYYGGYRSVSPVRRYGYGGYAGYGGRYVSSTAAALDAADGVIDGKYYGRPIVEANRSYPIRRGYPLSASVTRLGRRYYDDAAVSYGPRYYDGAYRPASVTRAYYDDSALAIRRPYYDDAVGRRYYENGLTGTVVGPRYAGAGFYPRSSAAVALDAADGVIDGRYYGRPIVEAPTRRYVGGSLAERLDAADGVIDGKYFGRRIVQA